MKIKADIRVTRGIVTRLDPQDRTRDELLEAIQQAYDTCEPAQEMHVRVRRDGRLRMWRRDTKLLVSSPWEEVAVDALSKTKAFSLMKLPAKLRRSRS